MAETVYIRMRNRIEKRLNEDVLLQDLAQVIAADALMEQLEAMVIYRISEGDRNIIVIDSTRIIKAIRSINQDLEIQIIGPAQTIIEVILKKRSINTAFFASLAASFYWICSDYYELS